MNETGINSLVRMTECLAFHSPLSFKDRAGLLELPYASRSYAAGSYLIREGDTSDRCSLIVSGIAFSHKVSGKGQRQIVSIHIPGEVTDLQGLYLETADHNIQTLTRCEVATIPHAALRDLGADRPSVARAIVATMLVELAIAREWMLNIGRRDARTRIAHLLCELSVRLDRRGLPPGQDYELPMTQEQFGDVVGLTAVHINRTLKTLSSEGLVTYNKHIVKIHDWEKLIRIADFNSLYLHTNL